MVTHTIEELHELFKSGELDVKEYYKELFEEAKKQLADSKAQLEEGQKEFDTQFTLAEDELNQKSNEEKNE